jgi:hypothetical protein
MESGQKGIRPINDWVSNRKSPGQVSDLGKKKDPGLTHYLEAGIFYLICAGEPRHFEVLLHNPFPILTPLQKTYRSCISPVVWWRYP